VSFYQFLASIADAVGMVGVTAVLIAFYLINTNKLTSLSMGYQVLNLIGSVLLLFSLCFHVNKASVAIEFAWISISLMGIFRILRDRRTKQNALHKVHCEELNVSVVEGRVLEVAAVEMVSGF
jgi:hypothetical protein